LGRSHRVLQQVEAGWIVVNATRNPVGGPVEGGLPAGGHKQSGIGVEGGLEGIEAYMTKTAVQIFV
jgi:acyl-CoA reductase-like NAD-dependent aldehyde dehydrogenase